MNKFKKSLYFLIVFLIMAKIAAVSAIFLYPKDAEENLDLSATELIQMTNDYRAEHGLTTLSINPRLTQAAVNKARDLFTNEYFNHTSPAGRKFSDWIKEVDYQYFYVGENLAIDFDDNVKIFQAWLDSPSHRENIEKSQYQEIGLAVLKGKFKNRPTIIAVQLFGTRVLGANNENEKPAALPLADYFYPENRWQKIFSLENITRGNEIIEYLLLVLVGLAIITYRPIVKNQINIKQPIINRYQAKAFRE